MRDPQSGREGHSGNCKIIVRGARCACDRQTGFVCERVEKVHR